MTSLVCAVFVCDRTLLGCESFSFTADGYGIFNVRTHLGGKSGTNKSAQVLTRRDRITAPHAAPAGDRTQGLSDFNSDALTDAPPPAMEGTLGVSTVFWHQLL